MDVGRDLGHALEGDTHRAHAGQPSAGFADAGGDDAREPWVGRVEEDVERGERRTRRHERRAGGGVRLRRARGRAIAGRSSIRSRRYSRPALAEVGALPALVGGGELAVEEYRDLELGGDPVRDIARQRSSGSAVGIVDEDDRADVERADARMGAVMAAHVDRLCRGVRTGEERLAQRTGLTGEADNRAVVDGVEMEVEQERRVAEGIDEVVDLPRVLPLRDVRDGQKHPANLCGKRESVYRLIFRSALNLPTVSGLFTVAVTLAFE